MADILKIAQSGLSAAQVGMSTTSHNISNANTPGYSRQMIVQAPAGAQDMGFGFVGKGTEILTVQRVYSEFLNNQVVSSQASKSQLDSYYAQIKQVDNMLSDSATGLTPTLQGFFDGVQSANADPNNPSTRQTMLSSAQTLASRFQSLSKQLSTMQDGVNKEVTSSVGMINTYARQLAELNDSIEKLQSNSSTHVPNDLLDQRDQIVAELSKETKVSVVKQNNSYNVFIGTGQPLVVGKTTFDMVVMPSPEDPTRLGVGYQSNGSSVMIAENSLAGGGRLAGLLDFRSQTLDPAQNALGRVALGLATTFNAQHRLGQDQTGAMGGDFFTQAVPSVAASTKNTGTAVVGATITNVGALTTSDYRVSYDSSSTTYSVTRISDGAVTTFSTFPRTIDGVRFDLASGTMANGDTFLVRPTVNGATSFSVAITDKSKIALATPIQTARTASNSGTGTISAGVVNASTLMPAVTLSYNSGTGMLSGFPSSLPVTITTAGTPTTYAAGTANIPYTAGSTISFGGVSLSGIPTASSASYVFGTPAATLTYNSGTGRFSGFPTYMDVTATVNGVSTTYAAGTAVPYTAPSDTTFSFGGVSVTVAGTPGNGDSFTVAANPNGVGDSRNGRLLASLQTANTLDGGFASYQGAYSQLVNTIGNKSREVEVVSQAAARQYSQAVEAQQSESGVNLDEEATDLLRYQQAYQAAAKVIQTANKLFETLLSLGA